jgi:hypothetical protein
MNDFVKLALFLIFFGVVVVVGPMLCVWALNTLFPLAEIPYNFWTWLAIVILYSPITIRVVSKKTA